MHGAAVSIPRHVLGDVGTSFFAMWHWYLTAVVFCIFMLTTDETEHLFMCALAA